MKLFTLLALFFLFKISFTQTNLFAPVGAQWWYSFAWNGIDFEPMFYHIESLEDTIVFGKECRKLESKIIYQFTEQKVANFYIYQSNDTVYYSIDSLFEEQVDTSFHVLYNFNALVNDTLDFYRGDYSGISPIVHPDDSTDFIIIDSISIENFGGYDLKKISYHSERISPWGCWVFDGSAYELIGNINYLLPLPISCLVKDPYPNFLLCYEDPNVGIFHFYGDKCFYFDEVKDDQPNLKIYPNPAENYITMYSQINNFDLKIYNLQGVLVQKHVNVSRTLDISQLPIGNYILHFQSENKIYYFNLIKM